MDSDELRALLAIPLYGLFHIATLEESSRGGYLYDMVPGFGEQHTEVEQERILAAIEEALANPGLDLEGVLPNIPYRDEEIREHLRATLRRLRESQELS